MYLTTFLVLEEEQVVEQWGQEPRGKQEKELKVCEGKWGRENTFFGTNITPVQGLSFSHNREL